MMITERGYTFDDLLLIPKKSRIKSRSLVNTSVKLSNNIILDKPILSANMVNVINIEMATKLLELGCMPVYHRFFSSKNHRIDAYNNLFATANDLNLNTNHICYSFGVGDSEKELFKFLLEEMPFATNLICLDVAHGHHDNMLEMISFIKELSPTTYVIAGNVATADGAADLVEVGANAIKVGIGPSGVCSTRTQTGNGVPQMTALEDVYLYKKDNDLDFTIISDGGIKYAGDIVKALCYADVVMLGGLLARSQEAPGERKVINGIMHKIYAGSSTLKNSNVEGYVGWVPVENTVEKIINNLMDGLKSGLSYQGVDNLIDLKKHPKFVELSPAGLAESKAHSIVLNE